MLYGITTKRLLLTVEGSNDEGQKFKQVHKVDGPHKGSKTTDHNVNRPQHGSKT